jgi:hypothetical protein
MKNLVEPFRCTIPENDPIGPSGSADIDPRQSHIRSSKFGILYRNARHRNGTLVQREVVVYSTSESGSNWGEPVSLPVPINLEQVIRR